jgi:hypothetical protein
MLKMENSKIQLIPTLAKKLKRFTLVYLWSHPIAECLDITGPG